MFPLLINHIWKDTPMTEELLNKVSTHSRPSDLRITDIRVANLAGLPMRVALIRIDTNQGISGYGEVRDGASMNYALTLKRQLIGENPCNIDKIFRKIKQFGHHARQAGGVCAVDMALFDLAGRVYGVPAYQLVGGKFRDKVLCYSDTPSVPDGKEMGERLKGRMQMGFKFLKMDVGIDLLRDVPGSLIAPSALPERVTARVSEPLVADRVPSNPTLEAVERAYIMWVLQSEGGNKSRAAEALGIDPSTLYRKLSRYGVEA